MSIDKLVEKTTIKFLKPLNLRNAEKLLLYISEHLPGTVNYHIEQHKSLSYNKEKKKSTKDNGTLTISTNISNSEKVMAFDFPQLIPWEKDSSYVSSIQFPRLSDNLMDYRPEVQRLWDDVRKIVENYFKEREFCRI